MGGERVLRLDVINIERHNKVDVNTVINIFGKQHSKAKYLFRLSFIILEHICMNKTGRTLQTIFC